jgi:hypothetical protein
MTFKHDDLQWMRAVCRPARNNFHDDDKKQKLLTDAKFRVYVETAWPE